MIDNLLLEVKKANPEILNRTIREWYTSEIEIMPFVKEKYWQDAGSVNIFRIVGTQHPDYAGLTWLSFLGLGKRMYLNLDLFDKNPGYYRQTEKKIPSIYYQSIDGGDLYVGGDGNHRTAIAKAAFFLTGETMIHGVTITDYRIDWKLKEIYEELTALIATRKLPYKADIVSKTVSRDDTAGWMLEKYDLKIKLFDFKKQKTTLLYMYEAKKLISDLSKNFWNKFWR
ncbi:MAG: hypothetical protein ACYCSB_01440 [bacterium]|jgi:hypothetical protein